MASKLVILDFDGTLYDTHKSILHSLQLIFAHFTPNRPPPPTERILAVIGSGVEIQEAFRILYRDSHPGDVPSSPASIHPSPFDEPQLWLSTFRTIYAEQGQPLTVPFAGSHELLATLADRSHSPDVTTILLSNKRAQAIVTALRNNALAPEILPDTVIIGAGSPGWTRKPSPATFEDAILPLFRTMNGGAEPAAAALPQPDKVLVVGDTEADIVFARNIGAKSVWCRFGYGDAGSCMALNPDYVVDSLPEVQDIIKKF